MTPAPDGGDAETLDSVERQLARGELDGAVAALLTALEGRGDAICALAARLLRLRSDPPPSIPPDALAAALDRLVQLVRRQEEQIRTLQALVEDAL